MDETTVERRRGIGFKGILAWIVIVVLLGAVAFLASERNARRYHLVPSDGRLVVMRGLMLPAGRTAFTVADPSLAQAYAPLVPPPGKPLPQERTFEERGLLDQAIYELVSGWAREEIASGEPARLERGLGYLARAEKLPGLSSAQREDLAELRVESGYHEAKRLLSGAVEELREAADRLRRAAQSRSPHAADAAALLSEVEPALEAAAAALRAGGERPRPPGPEAAQGAPPSDTDR